MQFVAANAQDAKVEIYDVSSNSIITGFVTDSIGDSIYVQTDKFELIAFAKVDMQGLNYGVSKEIKKLQRELIRNEMRQRQFENPGVYQMQNNEARKGKIMSFLTKFGHICTFVGGCLVVISGSAVLVAALTASESIVLWGGIFTGSLYTFLGGLTTSSGTALWSVIDKNAAIQSKIKKRYYFSGENMHIKMSL
jgi:hypothetical protein